ncbi:ATP-dependent sacrificial sulfur transferase LarE [Amycolatopsis sp. CA-128772]|uniref:ATP-dependent sacrificial sulfur transferase LarE n=1 Tax=Amycolatopsis sp. CA-128772 TaxID=2073159 RepID=UPI000CD11D98|nr:ATP-dependent sacrificial sulfur transferase LarE [Amycolatopsis sp. CA-128772]
MDGTRLVTHLAGLGRLAVAFSGGADSALVLAAAVRALGPADVLAVTANSASLAAAELAEAKGIASDLGVRHLTPPTAELAEPGYAANGRRRCYFCKTTVLTTIAAVATAHGFPALATGTNADDAADPFRPGIHAGDELGVHTPLRTLGLSKEDVRALARQWGFPWAGKPAAPCLASRVRYGIPITPATLARVERAESAVRTILAARGRPSRDLRVRDLGGTARIELDTAVAAALHDDPRLLDAVRALGFAEVTVTTFRSGALND